MRKQYHCTALTPSVQLSWRDRAAIRKGEKLRNMIGTCRPVRRIMDIRQATRGGDIMSAEWNRARGRVVLGTQPANEERTDWGGHPGAPRG